VLLRLLRADESPSSEGKDRHGSSTLPARLNPQKDPSTSQGAGENTREEWKGTLLRFRLLIAVFVLQM
jgi:hypothetical protein